MKGLSKRTRMAFSFFEYLPSFQRYSSSRPKIDGITNCISTKINHKILNISGNIGVMLLKLGTNNVCQVSSIRDGGTSTFPPFPDLRKKFPDPQKISPSISSCACAGVSTALPTTCAGVSTA